MGRVIYVGNSPTDFNTIQAAIDEANAGDFTLLPQSHCIDAGTNDPMSTLPLTDLTGTNRIIDGDLDGIATVDMGA